MNPQAKPVMLFKTLTTRLLLFAFFVLLTPWIQAQPNGESIFKANCTACHSTGDQKVVGPGLKDIHKRRSEVWLIKWIKNSSALIKSGDKDAVAVFEENNKVAMPAFGLSDEEIKSMLVYIKAEGDKAAAAAPTATAPVASEEPKDNTWTLLIIILILLGVYLALKKIENSLNKVYRQRNSIPEPVKLQGKVARIHWIREHKKQIALVTLILIGWGSWEGWYALAEIGVNTGYQPEQPIRFSHALHAGQNGIDCRYCHFSAEKGKTAGIPSLNICMNCHKYVQQGPKYGKDEIAKIYKALDYDPATQQYGMNPRPVQWIKVHNLPDLAYFNHSQHTTVGGVECQTCHGPVQEMEEVKQFSPLTMGWCINCHRTTKVNMEGNGYYTTLHEDLKKKYGSDDKITVDKIGGLECARCHY